MAPGATNRVPEAVPAAGAKVADTPAVLPSSARSTPVKGPPSGGAAWAGAAPRVTAASGTTRATTAAVARAQREDRRPGRAGTGRRSGRAGTGWRRPSGRAGEVREVGMGAFLRQAGVWSSGAPPA